MLHPHLVREAPLLLTVAIEVWGQLGEDALCLGG